MGPTNVSGATMDAALENLHKLMCCLRMCMLAGTLDGPCCELTAFTFCMCSFEITEYLLVRRTYHGNSAVSTWFVS